MSKMDGRTEALLYAAARRQHFVEKISPLAGGQDCHLRSVYRIQPGRLAVTARTRNRRLFDQPVCDRECISRSDPLSRCGPGSRIETYTCSKGARLTVSIWIFIFYHKVRRLSGSDERFPDQSEIDDNRSSGHVFEEVKRVLDQFLVEKEEK